MALISCNLCGHQISSKANFCPKCRCPNIAVVQGLDESGNKGKESTKKEPDENNALAIPEDMLELFKLIKATASRKNLFGIPLFDSADSRLKYRFSLIPGKTISSLGGLCCGPCYYFARGMWRKGFVMTLIFALSLVMAGIVGGKAMLLPFVILGLILALSYFMATYDRYRHLVLGEKFWW